MIAPDSGVVGAKPTRIVVGVAECAATRVADARIVTYALGSCIAVVLYDPRRRVGGALHLMLPASTTNPARAAERPATFADTGVPHLVRAVAAAGADPRRCAVVLAGGAEILADADRFRIGGRNREAAHAALTSLGLRITAEDVGGTWSRTLALSIADGRITIRSQGKESLLWSPTN